ncbi:MAG: hypothetical protein ACYCS1_08805 [Gammaproteobacteria bacterium]
MKWFAPPFGLVLSVFWVTTGFHFNHPNGFYYLVGPLLGPWLSALLFIIYPRNPYRKGAAKMHVPASMVGLEHRDPDARRLVEIYRSPAAHRFLLRWALKTMIILVAVMLVVVAVQWDALSWSFSRSHMAASVVGCFIGSLLLVGGLYTAWGWDTWFASYEGQSRSGSEGPTDG